MIINVRAKSNKRTNFKKVFCVLSIIIATSIVIYTYLPSKQEPKTENSNENASPIISEIEIDEGQETPVDQPSEEELKLTEIWLAEIPEQLEETEWIIVVDRSEQKEYVFHDREFYKSYVVSTGSKDRYDYDATLPLGIWRIGEKIPYSLGEIYGPRLMYIEWWNGTSFEKTAKALHGTNEPENLGSPTSMGCIYHSNDEIIGLYDLIPQETLVITVE